MALISSAIGNTKEWIQENPAQFSTIVMFTLGFGLVATNALVSQAGTHPTPFWNSTQKTSERIINQEQAASSVRVPTRSVLTQRISLADIPVPTANPVKTTRIAAQSSLVREVQALLADAGIYSGKVDGIFGDETKTAILEYQKKAGIIPDGEASFGLLANIKSAFAVAQVTRPQQGPAASLKTEQDAMIVLDSNTVQQVQSGLRDIYGEDEISVDGVFGNQTRSVIRKFQKRFRLQVTGEIDQATMKKLREAGIIDAT